MDSDRKDHAGLSLIPDPPCSLSYVVGGSVGLLLTSGP